MGTSTCKEDQDLYETITEIVFKGIIFLFGFLTNISVILTFSISRKLRSNNMQFLCSLSFAGLLFAVLSSPLSSVVTISLYQGECVWGLVRVNRIIYYTAFSASISTLTCMSIERSYAICSPLKYKRYIDKFKVRVAVAVIWILSMTVGATEGLRVFTDKLRRSVLAIASIVCCYAIIITCYLFIFMAIKRQRKIHQEIIRRCHIRRKTERELAKTIFLIVGVFAITWSPIIYSFAMFPKIDRFTDDKGVFSHWSVTVGMASAVFNPLIYFFRSHELRKASRQVLCRRSCHRCRRDVNQESLKSYDASTIFRKTSNNNQSRETAMFDGREHLALNDWSRGKQLALFPKNLNVSRDEIEERI